MNIPLCMCSHAWQSGRAPRQSSRSQLNPLSLPLQLFGPIASQNRAWSQRLHLVMTGALQSLCRWEIQFSGYPETEGGGEATASFTSSSALDLGLGGALSVLFGACALSRALMAPGQTNTNASNSGQLKTRPHALFGQAAERAVEETVSLVGVSGQTEKEGHARQRAQPSKGH